MMEKDTQFRFVVNSFIMKNRSVNGIANGMIVNEFYELILDSSRCYLKYKPNADAKAVTSKGASAGKNSKSQNSKGCCRCGQLDHWAKGCPNPKSAVTQGGKGQWSSNWKSQSSNPSGKSQSSSSTEKPKDKKGRGKGEGVKKYTYAIIGGENETEV